MNELFTLVAFSVLRLSGIRDGRRLLARRTAVTGDAVLVDPSANVGAELLFELPELRPLGEVVFQVVCPEDRGADAGELQRDLLPLVLGDGRKVRRKDQVDGVVLREEQAPEQHLVGGTDCRQGSGSQLNASCVAFEGQTAAPFDHRPVELTRRMAHFEEMPQAFPEPFFIGGFHRMCGLAFATATLTLIRSLLLRCLGFLFLLRLLLFLLLTALLREIVDHAVRAGVDPQDTGQRLAVLAQNGMFLLLRAVQTFGAQQGCALTVIELLVELRRDIRTAELVVGHLVFVGKDIEAHLSRIGDVAVAHGTAFDEDTAAQGQFVLLRFIQTHAVEVAQFGDIAFRDGDKAVRRGIQGGEAPLLLARMRVGKFIKAVGSLTGQQLFLLARGEHHPVLLALELRARKGTHQADLHVAVLILIGMQGELSDNGHIADLEVHVMQFRTRKAVFHRLQLLRRDDDAHLLQLLKFEVRRIELDLFELIRGNRMLVQRLESLRVFRVVDEVDEFLSKIAGLVGSDPEKTERLIALHGLETLDEVTL